MASREERIARIQSLSDPDLAEYLAQSDVMRGMSIKVPEHFKTRTDTMVPIAGEEYQKRKGAGNQNLRDLYYNKGLGLLDKARTVKQPYTPIDTAHRTFLQSFGTEMPPSFVESVEDAFPSYKKSKKSKKSKRKKTRKSKKRGGIVSRNMSGKIMYGYKAGGKV